MDINISAGRDIIKKSIYVFSNGELKRQQNTLYFKNGKNKKYLPIENISEILIFGEVTINKKLLDFLSQLKILIHFFNYYGYYSGTFYPREFYNSGYMILKQSEYYLNIEKRIELARKFIIGSIENILCVLNYYKKRISLNNEYIISIENLKNKIFEQNTIEKLMGIEGNVRECYYKSFNDILKNDEFYFDNRTKRPPKSRINALISFGNSLIYTTILSEIYKTHLDPRIGFLHETNFRRFSLNLDVAEIFKPIIIDRTIFTLLNKNIISNKHFMKELNKVYLNDKGREIFIEQYEKKLKSTIKHNSLKRNVSYRRMIRMELYKLEKHLMNEKEYNPFIMRW